MKLSCSLKEAAYSAGETPHMAPAFGVCHLAPLDLESPVAEILARVLERVPLMRCLSPNARKSCVGR